MPRKSKATLALFTCAAVVTIVALLGGGETTAVAGPPEQAVLDWNVNAIDALYNPVLPTPPPVPPPPRPGAGQGPTVGQLHMAMVQGAVYDAVNMIDRKHEPFLKGLGLAPRWASKPAAVATAAHHVLVGLGIAPVPALPAPTLTWVNTEYMAYLAGIPNGPSKEAGIEAGENAAAAMLANRTGDGRFVPFPFACGEDAGEWRPTSTNPPGPVPLTCVPTGVSDPASWVAKVKPFTLKSNSQFRSDGPPALGSRKYAKEYDEVKRLGGNGTTTPTERTAEQTLAAQFFTANPYPVYSRMLRGLAQTEDLSTAEQARLLALVTVAGADAFINCWDDKMWWSNWRPITAIRLGDSDTNSRTVGDPGWTSFLAAPPYPDVSSGYNCITASTMNAAKAFFGKDKLEFDLTATVTLGFPAPTTLTRHYERFTDVVEDTIDARVWLGIHFRVADETGAELGKDVARWVDDRHFAPVRKKHDRCGDHDDD
jgi:vanadium-dependent haloperoxidase-like protein